MREIKFRCWDKKTKKIRAINSIAFHNEKEGFDMFEKKFDVLKNLYDKIIIGGKKIWIERLIKIRELKVLNEKEKEEFKVVWI